MKNCPNCKSEVPTNFDICWNCSFNFKTKKKNKKKKKKTEGFISDKVKKESGLVKPKKIDCLRCKTTMLFAETIRLHEGSRWGLLGDIGHLFTNRISFDIYVCLNCDKVEFFMPKDND